MIILTLHHSSASASRPFRGLSSSLAVGIDRRRQFLQIVAESSRQAAAPSPHRWSYMGGNAQATQCVPFPPIIYDQGSETPDALYRKLVKLKKKVRLLKKRALIIQREIRWLRDFDNSVLAFHRILFYEIEFEARKAALEEAVTAHEYIEWYLACILEHTAWGCSQPHHNTGVCNQYPVQH